ncbi:MAG: response regulator, partial [Methanococcaceae archaeon]
MEKILVIEDEADVRGSILDLIEAKGYETIAARNGREALDAIKHTVPDLVVSDIMMPEIDGYEVLRQFRSTSATASVPFIFLTAKSDLTDLRKGMNDGADDYLMKPFKARDLLAAIEVRLTRKRASEAKLDELRFNIAKYVPHELRTPLVAVLGFSQMTLDDYYMLSSDEIYDNLQRIKTGSKRLHYRIE